MIRRRAFVAGLLAAPAIVRTPALLMPIRPTRPYDSRWFLTGPLPFHNTLALTEENLLQLIAEIESGAGAAFLRVMREATHVVAPSEWMADWYGTSGQ